MDDGSEVDAAGVVHLAGCLFRTRDGRHFIAPSAARLDAPPAPPAYWVGAVDAGVHLILCGGDWDEAPELAPVRADILAKAARLMAAAGVPRRDWVPYLRSRGWTSATP
jgi:hypothetical protein